MTDFYYDETKRALSVVEEINFDILDDNVRSALGNLFDGVYSLLAQYSEQEDIISNLESELENLKMENDNLLQQLLRARY